MQSQDENQTDTPVMPSHLVGEYEEILDADRFLAVTSSDDQTGFIDDQGKFIPLHIEPGEICISSMYSSTNIMGKFIALGM